MSIFDSVRPVALWIGLALSTTAAEILFENDGKLTGDLVAMDSSGTITLVSPFSEIPILVNGDGVKSVKFGLPSESAAIPDQRLELVNGDVLPVRVEELDATSLLAASPDLGSFEVPREIVDSLILGVVPRRVVFRAQDSEDGWKRDSGGARNWEIDGDRFAATGQGTISRDIKLPGKFILRFKLDWDSHPNLRMYFGGPSNSPSDQANRYFIQFSGSGFEIRRESMGKNRFMPIVLLNRTPDQFPDNSLEVEIRADRTTGALHLYLNGQLEGRYTDPVPDLPDGGHFALVSQAPEESGQVVSGFTILEWDDRGDRHRSEDRGDTETDSMIGRFGERFGGNLTGIRKEDAGTVYLFKSDFQQSPIEMPEQEVSTVFFATRGNTRPEEMEGIILRLRGGGEMRVSACEFVGEKVKAVHPLLGAMELERAGITSLERRKILKAEPVEK